MNARTGKRVWAKAPAMRLVHVAALAALAYMGDSAPRSSADIVNVTRLYNAGIFGEAANSPQSDSYEAAEPPDPGGLAPVSFSLNGSTHSVPDATASSSLTLNGTVTLSQATGGMVITSNGTGTASADQVETRTFTESSASAVATFVFGFTLTNQSYDYQIDLGNVQVKAPAFPQSTASVSLSGGNNAFSESLSNNGPPVINGSLVGTLAPGQRYELTGSCGAGVQGNGGSWNAFTSYGFTLTLTPSAPEFEWVNTGGGTFATDSNWDPRHVPGSSDAAVFDKPGNYVVSLDQDVQNQKVRADGAGVNVTVDLAGHQYSVNDLNVGGLTGDNVRVGFMDSGNIVAAAGRTRTAPISLTVVSSMNVRGGGEVDLTLPTSSDIVNVDGGGVVTASGANAQWLAQSLLMGSTGAANLTLSNKAVLTTSFASVGVGVGAIGNGIVTVSDDGTAWSADNIVVGGQGTGSLNILHQGQVFAKSMVAGLGFASIGTITVDSGNSLQGLLSLLGDDASTGSLVIGDQGTGHLIVKGIGLVQVASLEVGRSVGGNGDVTITDPSSIIHAEDLKVGAAGTGAVNISNGGKLATSENRVGRAVIGAKGTIVLNTRAFYNAASSLEVDGKLQIDSSSRVVVGTGFGSPGTLTVLPGGTLSGAGTISVGKVVLTGGNDAFSGGILKPGHSPGTLTIDGDFEQDANSTLKIEIAGAHPGQFDVLNVTGNASFAGDLLLSFQDGFAPKTGDTFAFLGTAGTMTGSFANVALHDVAGGFQFSLQPQAGGGFGLVALNDAVSTRIPGDANDDGKVDFTDLLTLAQHYGQTATYSQGDFNLDGTVGFDDLLTLAQHYGQISMTPAELTFATVPEPAAGALCDAALFAMCCRRRRAGLTVSSA